MRIWKSLFFITKYMRIFSAAMLFVMLSFTTGEAYVITVDAAIRGEADDISIETGDSRVEGSPSLVPEVSISDTVSANDYTFEYFASSNIQAGTLKVMTSAVSNPGSLGTASSESKGMPQALAHIEEDLTFTPTDSNPYQVTLSMFIEGSISMDASTVYDNLLGLIMSESGGPGYQDSYISLIPSNSISQLFSVSLTLQGVSSVYIKAGMESYIYGIDGGGNQSIFALNNTAQLALSMPSGVSMTSSSGMFLSTVPVPEPATILLLSISLVGLVSVGAVRKIKRKTVVKS